ncbi:response regulator [Flavipsychrobacter stenotrophus]|uniref:Response regulator n=1 Tax=Flavipsychrobacter stenotrophus TaxID=2077091 RepID=A0A2S7SQQ0_9BACT|nr:response regulator [Flavipsychrobacter stenotrophus]PQJ08947.1 response regulator [Flavipsychrobacter stenotrophus]
MNKQGPIIIIEDDADDCEVLKSIFEDLNYENEIVFFTDGEKALEYLKVTELFPFLILSDVNLPKLDGFELRSMIYTNNELCKKCIPYLFFSTGVSQKAVYDAYTMSVQGFFLKPSNYTEVTDTIKAIVTYWQKCYAPNHLE